jgi:transcriptional regulator with XRE-family HTH domain
MNADRDTTYMNELQRLKMAWLAAEESGNTQAQVALIRDLSTRPNEQAALVDFIAAYYASSTGEDEPLLALTQRANATALERVMGTAATQVSPVNASAAIATLGELRKARNLTKQAAARGLRLSTDVWEQFERGAIELASLSQRQLERLAQFFQVGTEQFSSLLTDSSPTFVLNRRQTRQGVQKASQEEAASEHKKQSFKRVISRSTMSAEDKQFWLS